MASLVVDDEGGPVALEIFDRDFQVLEIDRVTTNSHTGLDTKEPEGDLHAHDASLIGIEGHDVQRLRPSIDGGPVRIRPEKMPAIVELDQRTLVRELLTDALEVVDGNGRRHLSLIHI